MLVRSILWKIVLLHSLKKTAEKCLSGILFTFKKINKIEVKLHEPFYCISLNIMKVFEKEFKSYIYFEFLSSFIDRLWNHSSKLIKKSNVSSLFTYIARKRKCVHFKKENFCYFKSSWKLLNLKASFSFTLEKLVWYASGCPKYGNRSSFHDSGRPLRLPFLPSHS